MSICINLSLGKALSKAYERIETTKPVSKRKVCAGIMFYILFFKNQRNTTEHKIYTKLHILYIENGTFMIQKLNLNPIKVRK